MATNDLTGLLQRLEAFEDKVGVRFEAISAFLDEDPYDDGNDTITVRGELHPSNGTSIDSNLIIKLSIYDDEGRVVETEDDHVYSEDFFGFHTFEISCDVKCGLTRKLRLFPVVG